MAGDIAGDLATPPLLRLDFDFPSDCLAKLSRSRVITSNRTSTRNSRATALHIIWHDTAQGCLAAAGLALAESRGSFTLERLHPDRGVSPRAASPAWLPAMAPAVLATAATAADLSALLPPAAQPPALVPAAGFAGHQRQIKLTIGSAPVTLTSIDGHLRGVAQEWPVCRLHIVGPADAALALAHALAADFPLAVPHASLAAAAFALTRNQPLLRRSPGAPAVPPGATLHQAMVLVTAWLADALVYWAPLAPLGQVPEPVHQMRVASRRLRSALALFRRAPGGAALAPFLSPLRDLAQTLGAARDWDVFTLGTGAAVGNAFDGDTRIAAMLTAATRKRATAYANLHTLLNSDAFRAQLVCLALLPHDAPWQTNGDDTTAGADHRRTLHQPAAAFAALTLHRLTRRLFAGTDDLAALAPDDLHAVRKHAKRLRYACEFFSPLFPGKTTRKFIARLADLQEALGLVNDQHVAGLLMAQLPGGADRQFAAGVVQGFVASQGTGARAAAAKAWRKLRREDVFWA